MVVRLRSAFRVVLTGQVETRCRPFVTDRLTCRSIGGLQAYLQPFSDRLHAERLWNMRCSTVAMQLTVNGTVRNFDGDPQMPLLWYLRDLLRLTGTKFGCGIGLCGACTVHVNGMAQRSCVTQMSDASGKEIVTIEALSTAGEHPVQQAWKQINVPQCGYCQSGQIMQAVALLKEKPMPTDQDIDELMQGNICRCGTYQRIRQAIHLAAGGKA
jgi:isoquinoline 1-oxidoreductase subunit alpha